MGGYVDDPPLELSPDSRNSASVSGIRGVKILIGKGGMGYQAVGHGPGRSGLPSGHRGLRQRYAQSVKRVNQITGPNLDCQKQCGS